MFRLLLVCVLFCCSCSSHSRKGYTIGFDPGWHSTTAAGRAEHISAFSTELLTQIGVKAGIPLSLASVSWDTLFEGLRRGEYDGVLADLMPYSFLEKELDFSSVYLPLGPVLVVKMGSPIASLDHVAGKQIAIVGNPSVDTFLEASPDVLIRYYDTTAEALDDLIDGSIDGALIDVLTATAYCRDLDQGQLKIVSAPLTDSGLRLIVLHGQAQPLLRAFNEGLQSLKSERQKLQAKWGLSTL
jgi:polar amino acid transport system substrate-binding protein